MSATQPDYDALAGWAESAKPTVKPGTKRTRGTPADHAALRATLEAGAQSPEEKAMLARATAERKGLSALVHDAVRG